MSTAAVILAAGKGTRMNSELPKVAHEAAGQPLVRHVVDAARAAGCDRLIVVVGYGGDFVKGLLLNEPGVEFAVQTEQKGTGHAVLMAEPNLRDHAGPVLVLYGGHAAGDGVQPACPCWTRGSGRAPPASSAPPSRGTTAAWAGSSATTGGTSSASCEEGDATDAERAVTEINTGCYAFAGPALLASAGRADAEQRAGRILPHRLPRDPQGPRRNGTRGAGPDDRGGAGRQYPGAVGRGGAGAGGGVKFQDQELKNQKSFVGLVLTFLYLVISSSILLVLDLLLLLAAGHGADDANLGQADRALALLPALNRLQAEDPLLAGVDIAEPGRGGFSGGGFCPSDMNGGPRTADGAGGGPAL